MTAPNMPRPVSSKAGRMNLSMPVMATPPSRCSKTGLRRLKGRRRLCHRQRHGGGHGALTSMLKAGDHVVSARALFGSCLYVLEEVLTRFGVEVTFVDGTDLEPWAAAIRPDTKAVFFESVSNPTLEVVDIEAVSRLAHARGAVVLVDNVFATPVFSKAVAQGADVVIYSATKHMDGQGRALGGVILGSRDFIRGTVEPYMKHTGGSMSPFTAWIMLKGLETMDLRVRAQAAPRRRLPKRCKASRILNTVIYPGLASHPQNALVKRQMGQGGTVLSLDVKGGKEGAFRFLNAIAGWHHLQQPGRCQDHLDPSGDNNASAVAAGPEGCAWHHARTCAYEHRSGRRRGFAGGFDASLVAIGLIRSGFPDVLVGESWQMINERPKCKGARKRGSLP